MSSTPVAHLFCVCANAMYFFLNKRTDNYSQILQNLFKKKNKSVRKEKEEKANDDGRPGKKCSMFLGSWNGLFNVPKWFFYNWINTLNIRANKEPLKMNYILKYNLLASRSKYAGNCSKCSSIWSFWKMFLRIQDPKIPDFPGLDDGMATMLARCSRSPQHCPGCLPYSHPHHMKKVWPVFLKCTW